MRIESTILGVKVNLYNGKQNVIFILDNNVPIKVNSYFVKQATSLEAHEFEMLVGQNIKCSYYEPGEVFNELGDVCEYTNTLIKSFQVMFQSSFADFYKTNSNKKYPFEKIVSVLKSERKQYIDIKTSTNNIYQVHLKTEPTGLEWKLFFLKDCYIMSLDNKQEQKINENLLLRLPTSFFKEVKKTDKKNIEFCSVMYKGIAYKGYYDNDTVNTRYNDRDFIDDALGGQADAIWNLD